jgi:hypothetical protein
MHAASTVVHYILMIGYEDMSNNILLYYIYFILFYFILFLFCHDDELICSHAGSMFSVNFPDPRDKGVS